ncbi:putative transcription factor cys6 protein [Botrytis fragariae]|uniref:Putative transcription factor cys6 protein n=1 Tax=Botrytis fragariae TaxID=1964551 RepID=A0A8H6EGI1_9HELO|nr:putative transcription factor cys6 protein [Botrytis fragariae]KAF5871338.1 putative transcription factor cys6 protein [Botrytis fragariae]
MQNLDEASKRTARSRTPTACIQCQKRKQKCSREQPCRHCLRRFPEVECIYSFEGKHSMVPPSPNRLSVPDDTPASFYADQETLAGRLSSIPSSQNYSSTVLNEAHHQVSEQNSREENMSYMPTFDITNSDPFRYNHPYQEALSTAIPASVIGSYGEQEMDPNELDFRPVPQVPTNTPDQIPFYDYMNGPHIETESWNHSSNLSTNSGMVDLQNIDQSYFIPLPTQTTSSQPFDINGSPAFHQGFGNNEMTNLTNPPDTSFSPGTPDRQNPDYGATDGYSGSYY